ncbi:fibronectin type III domain protein [gut metagenome]|uniref:Fibronectin type III domain protein n=1 Tax=gut metagenome TaxID=749906 RepID=J9BT48_9ZZZZ
MGYEQLFAQHYVDYAALFNRVSLKLNPSASFSEIATPQRLQRYRKGQPDYHLEELYFQFGRYLLIASSRPGTMPANLQGIWHNNVDGPWRVDYHNNINVQMNYWPACSTNLSECMLPLVDFIRTLVKPGEKTAQAYFGARGWTASISGNIFGFTTPLASQDMSWNFNPMAGPWLATHIWEYYDYIRDIRFLKEVGYDLIKSSADFAVDYLWHKPDGTYTAAPSTSPEHGPIDQGATFVHAVVREILLDAIEASKVLGVDKKERKQWQHVLDKLAPYQIGRYGQLMEWSTDIDDPKDEHRHVNHLFGLHPGHTVSPITTPELAKASRVVLEHRGDGATGWSMGWKLNQWARLQDGNHAYTLFGNLLKNGTLDNLWDTHPPFQIDGNLGGTAGVTEMLLQSHMGFIQLLPALPDAWKDGSVRGICAKGNFEVDLTWKDGWLTEAVICSGSGEDCIIKYAGASLKFKTVKGRTYRIRYDKEKKALFPQAGQSVEL